MFGAQPFGDAAMRYERNFEINEAYSWEANIGRHPSRISSVFWSSAFLFGILFWQSVISIVAWMIFAW